MRRLPAYATALLTAFSAVSSRAQPSALASWSPGERTTSHVRGEVGEPGPTPAGDGVYGRFDGDLELGLGAGAEADRDSTRGAFRASAHYFSMLGIYAGYSDAFGGSEARLARLAAVGVDVRPAFIPRWSKNMEQGPGVLDLAVDSISVGLGAFFAKPVGGAFGDVRGLELSGGFGLPLFGRAEGLWLDARGLVRWADEAATPGARPHAAALVLLGWHELVLTGLTHE